ncbi:MAG: rod shape-determining protein MreD [Frankiales bacterium]|nr:rod shape-determining protein MreD [Frankiales bacterium]
MRRGLLAAVVVLTALLLQAGLVNPLDLPVGHPDLVLLCVVALAVVAGPTWGTVLGFGAGLAADVMPPADHALGRLAMAYALVGYAAGLLEDVEERSVITTVAVVAGASAAVVLVFAGVGALLGDARVGTSSVADSLTATILYDVILAPFIVPLVSGAARRAEPVTTY